MSATSSRDCAIACGEGRVATSRRAQTTWNRCPRGVATSGFAGKSRRQQIGAARRGVRHRARRLAASEIGHERVDDALPLRRADDAASALVRDHPRIALGQRDIDQHAGAIGGAIDPAHGILNERAAVRIGAARSAGNQQHPQTAAAKASPSRPGIRRAGREKCAPRKAA